MRYKTDYRKSMAAWITDPLSPMFGLPLETAMRAYFTGLSAKDMDAEVKQYRLEIGQDYPESYRVSRRAFTQSLLQLREAGILTMDEVDAFSLDFLRQRRGC